MQYKTLGNTGLIVSRMCLGTMTFGSGRGVYKMYGTADQNGADELVKGACDRGVNYFDTADDHQEGKVRRPSGSRSRI